MGDFFADGSDGFIAGQAAERERLFRKGGSKASDKGWAQHRLFCGKKPDSNNRITYVSHKFCMQIRKML